VPIPKTPVAHMWIRSNGSHICMWRRRWSHRARPAKRQPCH